MTTYLIQWCYTSKVYGDVPIQKCNQYHVSFHVNIQSGSQSLDIFFKYVNTANRRVDRCAYATTWTYLGPERDRFATSWDSFALDGEGSVSITAGYRRCFFSINA